MAKDYYAILGVERDASPDEIKRAFRRVARESHPDANPGDPTAEDRFKAAAEAYEVLSDPERRRRYDRGDRLDLTDLFAGVGLDDLLRSVFGDGGLFGQSQQRTVRGRDVLVRAEIGLEEAATGTDSEIHFHTKVTCRNCSGSGAEPGDSLQVCPDCQGQGSVRVGRRSVFGTMMTVSTCPTCRGEGNLITNPCVVCGSAGSMSEDVSISVEVPAGVSSGTRLRLSGRGESAGRHGPPGDLYVEVLVQPHPEFERLDGDLIHRRTIGVIEATLGTTLQIPLIEGDSTALEVEPGTQPGSTHRLTGHGMPRLGRRGRGDLLVVLEVEVPRALSPREIELVREWEAERARQADSVSELH